MRHQEIQIPTSNTTKKYILYIYIYIIILSETKKKKNSNKRHPKYLLGSKTEKKEEETEENKSLHCVSTALFS